MKMTCIALATVAGSALLLGASTAFAQSTITGTLSSGGGSTTTSTSSGSGSSLTGTVSSPGSSTSGGTTGSTGGGGGGSGSNIIDICPNIAGTQSTLPSGYVMQNDNCVQTTGGTTGTSGTGTTGTTGGTTNGTGSVLGTTTSSPNVPNTGAGGDAATTLMVLATTGLIAAAGVRLLKVRAA